MSNFDDLIRSFTKIDSKTRVAMTADAFKTVYQALVDIYDDNDQGYNDAVLVALYAVAADGKFEEAEYYLVKPMLESVFGGRMDYSRAKQIIQNTLDDEDNSHPIDFLLRIKGKLANYGSDAMKAFVTLLLGVLDIDGEISYKEKTWLHEIF